MAMEKEFEKIVGMIANLKPLRIFENLFEARSNYSKVNRTEGVYAFYDPVTVSFYFGSTQNFNQRFSKHGSVYKNNQREHPRLHELFDKVGIENVKVFVFVEGNNLNRQYLTFVEESLMKIYKTLFVNVVSTYTSEVHSGKTISEEIKLKMREASKNRSDEHKQKLRKAKGTQVKVFLSIMGETVFDSYREAAQKLNISLPSVSRSINQNRKLKNGMQFFKV